MASQTIVTITDDLDGSEGAETVTFAFQGLTWEIDLVPAHVADLEKALSPYVAAGRRVARGGAGKSVRPPVRGRSDASSVREWARANGYEVSDRGRVSAEVREAYEASH